jgi:hypothetical protein
LAVDHEEQVIGESCCKHPCLPTLRLGAVG